MGKKTFNRKQEIAIRCIAAEWGTVCTQTAHEHNMTPKEAFSNPALTADFLADELGRLLNGHAFLATRRAKDHDARDTWNDAVFILAGCFPAIQTELVYHLTDQPQRRGFSIERIKRGLKKLIGLRA